MKVQGSRKLFKAFLFPEENNNKILTSSALDFPPPLITVFRRFFNTLFPNQHPRILL